MSDRQFQKCSAALVVVIFAFCPMVRRAAAQPSFGPAEERRRDYADGIRIDWKDLVVELDATVCLREGALELFACSPHTKEHESIVVLHARPRHIFEALGLIGLEPGTPATYDRTTDRSSAAHGAPLRIDVVVTAEGKERRYGIHEWMRMTGDRQPMPPSDWVFAGSQRLEGDRFAADSEGTLICAVDFDTALIALPESHSSDDEELWLEANTERIPPRGTQCLVRISSARRGRTVVRVGADGTARLDDGPATPQVIEERVRRESAQDPGANVLLECQSSDACARAAQLRDALADHGLTVGLSGGRTATQPASQPPARKP